MQGGASTQAEGEHREGTGVSGGLNLARREDVPAVVIPDERCRSAGQPRPSQALLSTQIVGPKGAQRLLQDRGPRGVPIGDKKRQTIEQKFRGTPGTLRSAEIEWPPLRPHPRWRLSHAGPRISQRSGHQGRSPRPSHVEALEVLGGFEQERGSVAAPVGREGDLGPEQVQLRSLEVVQRASLGHVGQAAGGVNSARLALGFGGDQRPARPPGRVDCQLGRPFHESSRRREPAAGLGSPSGELQVGRHVFVGA